MKTKLSTRLTLACLTFFSPLLATAQQTQRSTGPGDWPGPWHMWNGGWGFWWVFPLIMVFVIIACVAMLLLGHRAGGGGGLPHWGPGRSWGDPRYSALQILNERFARGEIQEQEYEERKAVIVSGGRN